MDELHSETADSRAECGNSNTALCRQGKRVRTSFDYIRNILDKDINFGVGPAGTGKTYLAVACAVQSLEQEQVRRLVLVRPAVEAGERLGFLPGDLSRKLILTSGHSMTRSMRCWDLSGLPN